MSISVEEFYAKCLTFRCSHCKAEKGDSCRDTRGCKRKPHCARAQEVRVAMWLWEQQKTAECPTCKGRGRVKVVGADATHVAQRTAERLVKEDSELT